MRIALPTYLPLAFLCLLSGPLFTAAANAQTAPKPDTPSADNAKALPPMGIPSLSISYIRQPFRLHAQTIPPMEMRPVTPPATKTMPPGKSNKAAATLPNLSLRKGWPSPVSDAETYSYLLFDLFEHRWNNNGANTLRWDTVGWRGGDYNRFWFKSEGRTALSSPGGGYGEVQALYGRLIAPYTDFQVGIRYDQFWGRERGKGRTFLALGVQSLIPYRFDIEPVLYIGQNGNISARFTGTYDTYVTQRLVLQPRFETKISLQKQESFGEGSGLNEIEIGLRLRYEIRREFSPYIGINWEQSIGQTASFARRAGEPTGQLSLVAGIRAWF